MSFSLDQTPELDAYRDEPAQLPSGSFGKEGRLSLRFERRGARSILAYMDRRAPLLVQRALYCDEGMPTLPVVFVISNAGGMLQGDRYAIDLEVAEGACGHVTTQAATKVHEMDANYAAQQQRIMLHPGAYLEYLPDQLIPFRHARFLTRTQVQIAPDATLLYAEILVGGRMHYGAGELFAFDLFSSYLRTERPDGTELFTEKFLIEPGRHPVGARAVMGTFPIFGNVVLLTPRANADRILGQLELCCDLSRPLVTGVSRLPNDAGLIFKVLGHETPLVKQAIRGFWATVRQDVVGAAVPPEFRWR